MKNTALAICATLFALCLFLLLDFCFSRFVVSDPSISLRESDKPYQRFDAGWFELKRRFLGKDHWGNKPYAVRTDADGFRIDDKITGEIQADIIFLGDSFTYGVNGAWEDTFVGMYASYTKQTVLNAGVSSYSPTVYLHQYQRALSAKRVKNPHIVVLGLDISDIKDEATRWREGELHPVAYSKSQWGLPDPSPFRRFLGDNLLFTKSVYRYLRYHIRSETRESVFDLPISAFTWQETQALDREYAPLGVQGGLKKTEVVLKKIGDIAQFHGGRLFLLIYPWPAQLKYDSRVVDWERFAVDACRQAGCSGVINTFPKFRSLAAANGDWYNTYYVTGDMHFNRLGNQVVFEEMVKQLPMQ